jgi:F-type H+-transporting ATPase subunit a
VRRLWWIVPLLVAGALLAWSSVAPAAESRSDLAVPEETLAEFPESFAEEEAVTHPPELPNIFSIIEEAHFTRRLAHSHFFHVLSGYPNECYSILVVTVLSLIVIRASRKISQRPGKLQNVIEMIVETFDNFICSILGKEDGRRFLPYLGTLFVFIWVNNMLVLLPLGLSPTSYWATTGGLALCTFCTVQFTAVTKLGPLGYLYHLCGEPQGVAMWAMVPLFLPLHIIGELAKPLSLALRLFGNVLGEDVLLGVFMMMGVGITAAMGIHFIGVPLHLPFMFLALLLGSIQALVFVVLSTIYILLVLPHEEHAHAEKAAGAHD